jgi:hypothetical protein
MNGGGGEVLLNGNGSVKGAAAGVEIVSGAAIVELFSFVALQGS